MARVEIRGEQHPIGEVFDGTNADVTGQRTLYRVPVSLSPSSPGPLLYALSQEIGIPLEYGGSP